MKFYQFINSIPKLFSSLGNNNKRFVLGNSSADYDSIFGSLIYAFFLTYQLGQPYLPLIDCKRNQIPLRFDVTYIMKKFNIEYEKLIYTQDIDMLNKQNVYYLYDHNFRDKIKIMQIIDHHTLKQYSQMPSKENIIIYPSASALTLLFYLINTKYLNVQQQLFKNSINTYIKTHQFNKQIILDQLIWKIIRNGILIDSFGFDIKQKDRWTFADKFAVQIIQKQIKHDLTSYQELTNLKFNQKMNLNLSLQQHLIRDYKQYDYQGLGKIQYSIVCLNPDLFIQNYYQNIIKKFSQISYQTYMIMFIWIKQQKKEEKQAQFGRQAIFIVNPKINQNQRIIIQSKIQDIFAKIGMKKQNSFLKWLRWNDPSVTVSRKKIDKLFRENIHKSNQIQGQIEYLKQRK